MTLFVVALVLLVLIIRDQRKAVRALDGASVSTLAAQPDGTATAASPAGFPADTPAGPESGPPAGPVSAAAHAGSVERGRIAAMGGVVNLIWLVVLALMVWRPQPASPARRRAPFSAQWGKILLFFYL
jgi:hypothetical protein